MNKMGFALIEILLVVALMCVIGGSFYFKKGDGINSKIMPQVENQTQEVVDKINSQSKSQQKIIDDLSSPTSSQRIKPVLE